ncbi:LacI family DNA-binding transcriptional regulator [Novosphingobium terrae]|uniref:LacI family DNA-binding transcriptional regulator n=1 Tax=Novosphingobium terrae TaxID=2726189 RepID=UPI00197E2BF7|nr:LacI family DNA-binding transcriptional regulator [Novosphingobium terrae]
MTYKPTSFDIAQRAGVSQPTVSRALRGHPSVSEATRKRIEAIAAQLNYAVDQNASRLRSGTTRTLALLFFEESAPEDGQINPFFLSMLGAISRACSRQGYDLLASFQELSRNWHVDYEDSHKADGIMLLGYGDYEAYRDKLALLEREGTHYVRWGAVNAENPDGTIGCDNRLGGQLAARHLLDRGYRRIAFLGDASSRAPEIEERYRGACDAMRANGVTPDPALCVSAETNEASGYSAAQQLLERDMDFDAVFAACDLIAVGAMRAFEEAGLSIPHDLGIVGFDDIPIAALTSPPLTTISQDPAHAGTMLVETLIAKIRGEAPPAMMLTPHLILRHSTQAPITVLD